MPLASSAATIASAWLGGTTRSSRPWRTSTGHEIRSSSNVTYEAVLFTNTFASMIPFYRADRATIAIEGATVGPSATGPCASPADITYTVAGHPEAVTFPTPALPAGDAFITQIDVQGPEYVTVLGTKPGCTIRFDFGPYTGRIPVVPGEITDIRAQIEN